MRNYPDNTCANTVALNAYLRRQEQFEQIEAMYQNEAQPILDQIEALANELKHLSMHYEDEYGYEFDHIEDIRNVIGN